LDGYQTLSNIQHREAEVLSRVRLPRSGRLARDRARRPRQAGAPMRCSRRLASIGFVVHWPGCTRPPSRRTAWRQTICSASRGGLGLARAGSASRSPSIPHTSPVRAAPSHRQGRSSSR